MKLKTIPSEFLKAETIIKRLEANGFDAYFVGGSVRDVLLGKTIHDVDIATNAYPEEIKAIFTRTVDVGIEHGTVLVLEEEEQYEITTFRTESSYQDFRRPDEVTFVRSLKEDLKRRDFTINALAMNINGEIIDLFDGIEDLNNKVIRAVGNPKERFHEDALRMMRGLRFASQLNFSIEPNTILAIETFHPLLEKISVERISIEFEKMLLGKNRNAGFLPFIETECYQYCPGLRNCGEELFRFSELVPIQIPDVAQAWALFLKLINISEHEIQKFLKEWKLSNRLIGKIQQLYFGLNLRLTREWKLVDIYHLGLELSLDVENMLTYFELEAEINREEVERLYEQLPIQHRNQLNVTGNDILKNISVSPGKWVGELLDQIEEAVINSQVCNEKKELLLYATEKMTKE